MHCLARVFRWALTGPLLLLLGLPASVSVAVEPQAAAVPEAAYRASVLMETQVKNPDDEDLGTIAELLIDRRGRVTHVVLREGGVLGLGDHRYLVPWERVRLQPERKTAIINVQKARLASEFAVFESMEPFTDGRENVTGKEAAPAERGGP